MIFCYAERTSDYLCEEIFSPLGMWEIFCNLSYFWEESLFLDNWFCSIEQSVPYYLVDLFNELIFIDYTSALGFWKILFKFSNEIDEGDSRLFEFKIVLLLQF